MKRLIALITVFSLSLSTAFATSYDYEGVTAEIYQHLTEYQSQFEVDYIGSTDTISQEVKKSTDQALEYDDYIRYVFMSYNIEYSYGSNDAHIKYQFNFRTDAEKETIVKNKVIEILKSLNLSGLSDYERVKRIIQYMDTHYSYDDSLTKFTAYDLISTNQAVCNGYAELFYLLAKGAGIPVRNQEGTLENTAHLWNLVKIGGSWYTVDVTNFHLYKRDLYVVTSLSSIRNKNYAWTKLVEPVVEYMDTVDVSFNSNTYSEDSISKKLSAMPLTYVISESTQTLKTQYDRQTVLTDWLDTYYNAEPESKPTSDYVTASGYIKELRELNLNRELIQIYSERLDTILKLNQYKTQNWFDEVLYLHTKQLGTKFNETATINALTQLETRKKEIAQKIFSPQDQTYYSNYIDTLIKKDATTLINYYKQQYQKTKKATFKDKYLLLAKKYGITVK